MIPMGNWGNKDPGEKLKKGIDWSADMAPGDTISNVVWTVTQGTVTISGNVNNETTCQIFVDGGVDAESSRILCTVTTSAGEILRGTMRLDVRTK